MQLHESSAIPLYIDSLFVVIQVEVWASGFALMYS